MKRGTTPTLVVEIEGLSALMEEDSIKQVDFIFKQDNSETSKTKLVKSYPSTSVTYDATNKYFYISFTEEQTRTFKPNTYIYMDTHPITRLNKILETDIIAIFNNKTLFEAEPAPDPGEGGV